MHVLKVISKLIQYTVVTLGLVGFLCGPVQAQTQEEIDALKKQIDMLIQRISELEGVQAGASLESVQKSQLDLLTQAMDTLKHRVATLEETQVGHKITESVPDPTGNLMSGLVAVGDAPRSFRIPGTQVSLRFGGYAKFDAFYDQGVMLAGVRYFPDLIAVNGTPSARNDGVTQLSAAQTRFSLNAQAPTKLGQLSAFIEMDFIATGNTARLRHGIGQAGPVLAGYTWSTFMDLYSLPPTVAITAPSGAIFTRQALLRWTATKKSPIQVAFALEGPKQDVTPTAATDRVLQRWPDLIATFRHARGTRGHVQFGGILRRVGVEHLSGKEEETTGWGAMLSGRVTPFGRDSFGFGGFVGDGIGTYIAGLATSPSAAAPGSVGGLEALRVVGGYANFVHWWNPIFRSTISYGYVEVDNTTAQGGSSVKNTQNLIGNLIWIPMRGFAVGLEYIYGKRVNKDGGKGTDPRVQFGIQFGFS